jgi:hypothetical protein
MGLKTKIKTAAPQTINSLLLAVIIGIFAAGLFLYGFVYIKQTEKDQISDRFRVLSKMGENIHQRYKLLATNTKLALQRTKQKYTKKESTSGPNKSLKELLEDEISNTQFLSLAEGTSTSNDRRLEFLTTKDLFPDFPAYYTIFTHKDLFFSPIERPDVFDQFIILEAAGEKGADIIYNSFPEALEVPDLSGLRSTKAAIEAGNLSTVDISGTSYRLFIRPIKKMTGKKWYIGGFIESEKFDKQVKDLDSDIVVYLLIGFLIFIFSIPILKLFLMSSFDQLTITDVVLTSLSVLLCILLLILLNIAVYVDHDDKSTSIEMLDNLSTAIQSNFHKELNEIVSTLETFDYGLRNLKGLRKGDLVYNILDEPRIFPPRPAGAGEDINEDINNSQPPHEKLDLEQRLQEELPELARRYNLFKLVFWMEGSGDQILVFSTRKTSGGLDNLSHRAYFKEAGGWNLDEEGKKKIMLESISSISSGEKLAAVSMKSYASIDDGSPWGKKAEVIAMTTQLTSVIDAVMLPGYGFCIIDKNGRVWFHSDPGKNLQEDFIKETGEASALKDAIKKKQERLMKLSYQAKDHRCLVTPMTPLPLFLVTFHDTTHTQTTQTAIIIQTVVKISTLLLFNLLLFMAAAAVSYRKSTLKTNYVPFDFLRPLINLNGRAIYTHLILATSTAILSIVLFLRFFDFSRALFLCLSAQLFVFILVYASLNKISGKTPCCKPLKFTLFILDFLILIHLASVFTVGFQQKKALFIYQGILAVVCLVFWLTKPKPTPAGETPDGISTKPHLAKRPYFWFIFSWLTLTCVIPPIIFFSYAFNHEGKISFTNTQLELKTEFEERNRRIDTFYKERIDAPVVNTIIVEETKENRKKQGIYAKIVPQDQPVISGVLVKVFKKSLQEQPVKAAEKEKTSRGKLSIYFRSFFALMEQFDYPFFLFAMIGILVLAYFIIRFVARNIFGLHLLGRELFDPLAIEGKGNGKEDPVKQSIDQFIHSGSHMIIQCQTGEQLERYSRLPAGELVPASVTRSVDAVFPAWFNREEEAEVMEPHSQMLRILQLDELPVDFENNEVLKTNLTALEQLVKTLQNPHAHAIIPMRIPLAELIDLYNDETARLEAQAEKDTEKLNLISKIAGLLEEISVYAAVIIVPLTQPAIQPAEEEQADNAFGDIGPESIRNLIKDEFEPSTYFTAIKDGVFDYCRSLGLVENKTEGDKKKTGPDKDELENLKEKIILKIQRLSGKYYLELWQACSRKERFVIYDIAQDGLININNREPIALLLEKGILKQNRRSGAIEIMNQSFRNYILSSVDSDDAKRLTGVLGGKGRWKSYRAPIMLVALGAAMFLAFQKDLMTDLNAIATAVIGGGAILTKFSGILSKLPFGQD